MTVPPTQHNTSPQRLPPLRVGVHLSLGRSPSTSLREARQHGARAAQIFASSPSAWKPPMLEALRYQEIRTAARRLRIAPLVIHAIYLINLASADPGLRSKSRASLIATLHAAAELGVTTVTTHIGSHGGRGFSQVSSLVGEQIAEVLERAQVPVDLALENSAGTGNIIGSTLGELAELLDRAARPPRLKVTLDTAHLCGAGWDFTVAGTAAALAREIELTIGIDRLALLHTNDSKAAPGSRRDRHEVVGEGYIGTDGFRHLLAEPLLRSVPWILETPDLGDSDPARQYRSLATMLRLDRSVRRSHGRSET